MLGKLIGIFTGGAGQAVGTLATIAGIVTALAPVAIFLLSDKSNEVWVTVTYREAAFWGFLIAVQLGVAWLTRPRATGGGSTWSGGA